MSSPPPKVVCVECGLDPPENFCDNGCGYMVCYRCVFNHNHKCDDDNDDNDDGEA